MVIVNTKNNKVCDLIAYYNAKMCNAQKSELTRYKSILQLLNTCPMDLVLECEITTGSIFECIVKYKIGMQAKKGQCNELCDLQNIKLYIPKSEIDNCELKFCCGNGCYANGNKHSTIHNVVIINEKGMYLFNDKYLVYRSGKNKIKGNSYILENYEMDNKKIIEYAIENTFIKELRALVGWYGLN